MSLHRDIWNSRICSQFWFYLSHSVVFLISAAGFNFVGARTMGCSIQPFLRSVRETDSAYRLNEITFFKCP